MIIRTNIVSRDNYDQDGNLPSGEMPQMYLKNTERVTWILYSATPSAGSPGCAPDTNWTKYTGYSGVTGIGARLVCDNNYIHRLKWTLKTALSAGTITEVVLDCSSATDLNVPKTGMISLFSSDGTIESVRYTSRSFSGTTFTFTLESSSTITKSYAVGATADTSEAVFMSANLNGTASDVANGKFVFDITAWSPKLANVPYDNEQTIANSGMELCIYKTNTDQSVEKLQTYNSQLTLLKGMVDLSEDAEVAEPYKPTVIGFIDSCLALGFDVQIYNSTTSTWITYDGTQTVTNTYTKWRYKSKASGATTWAEVPLLPGADGQDGTDGEDAPEVKIQYSADNTNWHDTYASTDKYIRFSTDDGTTYSSGMKFIGSDAPDVQIQYSATGGSGTWHSTYASTDYYIHFSVDGGTTWGGTMQSVAYTVKFTYGSTASADFHADYVSGVDKYMKMSADNGVTWTSAILFCGADGQSFTPDATGTYSNRSTYDAEEQGFAYLVTSGDNEGKIYFKKSDTSADWSDGLQFTPSGVSIQYSADGTSWHTTQSSSDFYIRFSVDGGTTWSTGGRYQGTSAYCYYAYASDSSGNDFSLTPTSGLVWRNEIHTATVYTSEQLTLSRFTSEGIGWYKYVGSDGTTYSWLSGTTTPATATGNNGDWYINTSDCNVYKKVSGSWDYQMNIKGATGAGVTLRGIWDSATTYIASDMVTYLGSAYIAVRQNTGVIPSSSTSDWTLYISKGDKGDAGEALDGNYVDVASATDGYIVLDDDTMPTTVEISNVGYDIDANWITHDTTNSKYKILVAPFLTMANLSSFSGTWRVWRAGGKAGNTGTGCIPRGTYDATVTYSKTSTTADSVYYQGSQWYYINSTASSGNPPPTLPTTSNEYWQLLVKQGDKGDQGETGATGTAAGFGTPTATAVTLSAGRLASVSVTASGEDTEKVFAFTFGIPKGDQGIQGIQGEDGYTPVRGTDYWTTADINTIKAYCINAIETEEW